MNWSKKMSVWKFIIFYCVISLGISFCWVSIGSGITRQYFQAFRSVQSTVGQIHETYASSRLRCLIICTHYEKCSSVIFDTEDRVCRLFYTVGPLELDFNRNHSLVYTTLSHLQNNIIIYSTGGSNASSSESSNLKISLPDCPNTQIKYIKLSPTSTPLKIRCFRLGITVQKNGDTTTTIFNKNMASFRNGIGNVSVTTGKYMMSLNLMHRLTSSFVFSLEIKPHGGHSFKLYDFMVGNSSMNYQMTFSGCSYSGAQCEPSMLNLNGTNFSTKEFDNDDNSTVNCANEAKSGFWYSSDCNPWDFNNCNSNYLTLNCISRMYLKSNDKPIAYFQKPSFNFNISEIFV